MIGRDYPRPIVDHATIHKKNIERMKAAYEATGSKSSALDESDPESKVVKHDITSPVLKAPPSKRYKK